MVMLRGSIARLSRAFGVNLGRFRSPHGVFRGRTGPVHVPDALADAIEAVFGLDNRPAAWPRFRLMRDQMAGIAGSSNFHAFTAAQVARLYGFLPSLSAAGQRIAIVELAGGFSQEDLAQYFLRFGLQLPGITAVSVDGGKNLMGIDPKADSEVALDIQVAGAAAQGASIVVYFAPDSSEQGYLDAFSAAVHDSVNRPTVISLSWGAPETYCTPAFLTQFDQIAREAGHLGITVSAASGDDGSYDLPQSERTGNVNLVDFPASSPSILSCGGTRLIYNRGHFRETVWNDFAVETGGASGGGVSSFFSRPAYQNAIAMPSGAQRPMRGVPDVAGNADPLTGYLIRVNGSYTVGGGTSAVAPLWAALIARINGTLGRSMGFINPLFYRAARHTFRDVTSGNNGAFAARPGWDPCTGLGTPRCRPLIGALKPAVESRLTSVSVWSS